MQLNAVHCSILLKSFDEEAACKQRCAHAASTHRDGVPARVECAEAGGRAGGWVGGIEQAALGSWCAD